MPAFGLRVTPNRKSWIVFYRVKGKAIFETLGTTWLIPKIDTARDMARERMLKARSGKNPVEEKRAAKQQEASKDSTQFKAVIERYFTARAVNQKPGTAKEARRLIEKDVLPHWAKKDISTIPSAEVRRLLDKIQDRGGTLIVANLILVQLRSFFRWATRAEFIGKDPTAAIDKLVKNVERDRILTDQEIIKFWKGCEIINWPYGSLLKLLLLTGQRRDEVGQLEWSEVDMGTRLWTLPGNKAKK